MPEKCCGSCVSCIRLRGIWDGLGSCPKSFDKTKGEVGLDLRNLAHPPCISWQQATAHK